MLAHAANLRQGRHSETGRIYLLTTVTHRRLPVFRGFGLARLVISELRACDVAGEAETLAYVLMPDHLHWLLRLGNASLASLARRFKSNSARRVNAVLGQAGIPLWQAGFHDHALRRDEDLIATARYVVANPVRAGLVRRAGDYPHWDAVWI